MFKLLTKNFWEVTARLILRNKIGILISILIATLLLSSQWKNMRFTYTEANLLPDEHPINITYEEFLKTFGEEGNLIVIVVKDSNMFTTEKLNARHAISDAFKGYDAVESVIAIKEIQKLVKDTLNDKFSLEPFIKDSMSSLT